MNILKRVWQFMNPFYDPYMDQLDKDMKKIIADLKAQKLALEQTIEQHAKNAEKVVSETLPTVVASRKAITEMEQAMSANNIQHAKTAKEMLAAEVNIEIPEFMIQQAAMAIGGDNNFAKLLINGDAYRVANLTPVYLTNQSQTVLRVSAKEYFENPRILN